MPIDLLSKIDDPVEFTVFTRDTDGVVTLDLGDNPDDGLSYSLWCSLQPTPYPGKMEFSFWLADYDPQSGHLGKIWNGTQTKALLRAEDRGIVLWMVTEGLRALVTKFTPRSVFMQTMYADLPEKALAKYQACGMVLEELGYKFWRLSPYHGYEAWLAERLEQ